MEGRELSKIEKVVLRMSEVQAGKGIIQNEYHAFEVYDHTLEVVKQLRQITQSIPVIIAGYLHDIGKPVVAQPRTYSGVPQYDKSGRARHTFPKHEIVGAEMVRAMPKQFFQQFSLPQKYIADLVEHHYMPIEFIKKLRATKTPEEFLVSFIQMKKSLIQTEIKLKDLMDLFAADSLGKGVGGDTEELLKIKDAIFGKDSLKEIYKIQSREGRTKKYGYALKN